MLTHEAFTNGFVCSSCGKSFQPSELMSRETIGVGHVSDAYVAGGGSGGNVFQAGNVLNCFRIDSVLGYGSFGSVYRATDLILNRTVALKIPRFTDIDNSHLKVLIREARVVAKLRHPNIVAVHEVRNFGKHFYLVSDCIDGISLKEVNSTVRFECEEIATLISKLAHAVHYAHANGVIHRDLKPANVIVDAFGEPYLTDFGIAFHELSDSSNDDRQVVGTPAYMAPEQAFSDFTIPNPQLDVFSLGVMLHELLFGHLPGREQFPTQSASIVEDEDTNVPDGLRLICEKAIAEDPVQRYSSAAQLAHALDHFNQAVNAEQNVQQRITPAIENKGFLNRRSAVRNVAAAAAIAAMFLLILFPFFSSLSNYFVSTASDSVEVESVGSQKRKVTIQLLANKEVLDSVERIEISKCETNIDYGLIKNEVVSTRRPSQFFSELLKPGAYRVTVFGKDLLHAANRDVPDSSEQSFSWKPLKLNLAVVGEGDTIKLGPNELVKVDGGIFEFGSEHYRHPATQELLFPFVEKQVDDFYISKSEVTVREFKAVLGFVPDEMSARYPEGVPNDIPVTNVSFEFAQQYCECVGGRLPKLVEYVYVASNRGETTYPWGNTPPAVVRLDSGKIEIKDDVSRLDRRIKGLYSSVVEWTIDINMPLVTGLSQRSQIMLREIASRSRVVVGGTLSCLKSQDEERVKAMKGVRCFGSMQISRTPDSHQGFRVYR